MELLDPEMRVVDQEAGNLVAAEVVDQRAPVGVAALARVGVLVEAGAVEAGQPMRVVGEVAGGPVEDHADTRRVKAVDEVAEVVGRAEPAGRREEPDRLVAPRTLEGMLGHRQQLDVGEAEIGDVRHEPFGDLAIAELAPVLAARPRTQMHLVDADRAVVPAGVAAPRHPGIVAPGETLGRDDHARGLGRALHGEGQRIGLVGQPRAVAAPQRELVEIARPRAGGEDFPYAAGVIDVHPCGDCVPAVERADHGRGAGVGRPDGEAHARDAVA